MRKYIILLAIISAVVSLQAQQHDFISRSIGVGSRNSMPQRPVAQWTTNQGQVADFIGVSPNGSIIGSPGDVVRDTTGKIWLKTSGVGTATNWSQIATGSGISDGDKGDVIVSSSGSVFTIDASSIDSTKVAPSAIQSSDIANGGVWNVDLASNSVDSNKIKKQIISVFNIARNGASTGQVLTWNGNMWIASTATGGISSLNGLAGATQLFATGTSGTDFGISSVGTTHTFNLPSSSAANRGLLLAADWTTFNNKVGGSGSGSATGGYIPFFNGTRTVTAPSIVWWDEANARLGLGTTSPSSKLHLIAGSSSSVPVSTFSGTYTGTGTLNMATFDMTWNPASAQSGIFYAAGYYVRVNGSQTHDRGMAQYNVFDHATTNTVVAETGVKNEMNSNNGGAVTDQYGNYNLIYNANAVANGTARGVYNSIQGNYGTGIGGYFEVVASGAYSPTNSYGVFIPTVTGTNRWGVYAGTSAPNYFNGSVGIGLNNPSVKLDVVTGAASTTAFQRWTNNSVSVNIFGVAATPESSITASRGDVSFGIVSSVGKAYIKKTGDATNTGWDELVSASSVYALPAGTNTHTLRHNGTNWVDNDMIVCNGTTTGIGGAQTSGYELTVYGDEKVAGKLRVGGSIVPSNTSTTASVSDSTASLSKVLFENKLNNSAAGMQLTVRTSSTSEVASVLLKGRTEQFFGFGFLPADSSYQLVTNATGALNSGNVVSVLQNKNVGIQQTLPTAVLHIGPGSSTISPLKMTSATIPTTSQSGEVSFDGVFHETTTSGLRYTKGGAAAEFYSDVSNTSTTETDLYSYTTPANTLANNGEKIDAEYFGLFTDITATAQMKISIGGQNIFDSGALTLTGSTGSWHVKVKIIRSGSTTVRSIVTATFPGCSTTAFTVETDVSGITLSGTNILKITGQAGGAGGGSGDIVAKGGDIRWMGASHN